MKRIVAVVAVATMAVGMLAGPAQARRTWKVTFKTMIFSGGTFYGKVTSERRLCLAGRSVMVFKKGRARPIGTAPLNFSRWGDKGHATFQLSKSKGSGLYWAGMPAAAGMVYGRSQRCAEGYTKYYTRVRTGR